MGKDFFERTSFTLSERDTGPCLERKSDYFNNQLSNQSLSKRWGRKVSSFSTNASGETTLPESSVQTPNAAIKHSEKDYHAVLKRLGESPVDGVSVLKSVCMDSSAVTSNDDFQETDPTFSG